MRVFVTGFGPFNEIDENPSAKLAEGCGQPARILPVSYRAVTDFLAGLQPAWFDVLLMLGVATKRDHLTPELFGRNYRGDHADVDGKSLKGEIDASGPLLVPSTLWTPELLSAILLDDRFRESMDAGEYLCNDIAYRAVRRFPDKRVGFLHVPPVEKMPLGEQAEALQFLLRTVLNEERSRQIG